MKKEKILQSMKWTLILTSLLACASAFAQTDGRDKTLIRESNTAKMKFSATDKRVNRLFHNAYGYVIFPNVGKGAIGVGGAAGNGIVYENGVPVGRAKMLQLSVGLQGGGQAYREVIFFESKNSLRRFKDNKIEFTGQVSAVAADKGSTADVDYRDGVLVFTQEKGGLMLQASVGGQKFNFYKF